MHNQHQLDKLKDTKGVFKGKLYLIFLTSLFCTSAFADGMFRADYGYVMDDVNQAGSDNKTTRQLIDFSLGYRFDGMGWTLLGNYAIENDSNSSSSATRNSYGPGFGWISTQDIGPYFLFSYYLSSTYESGGTKLTGTGYQFDAGVKFNVSAISIIGGFSYEKFEYTKDNSTTLSPSTTHSHIDPRVGFMFFF